MEELNRLVCELQEDVSALQIKVGALESLALKDDETRAKYTELVSAHAEALLRQRKSEAQ